MIGRDFILYSFFTAFLFVLWASSSYSQVPQWQWAKNISTSEHEEINDVVADKSTNDVYVVGEWKQDLSATFPAGANPCTDFTSPYGMSDGLVAKYDSAGNLLWAFKLGGPNDDKAEAISIDPGGNIYITGYFGTGTSYFSGTSPHTPASTLDNPSDEDFFIAKYDSSGAFQWVKRSTTNFGNLRGLDLYATSSAVYACGQFDGWATFGPLNSLGTPNGKDIFLVKYNLDGDEQWIADAGGNQDDFANGVIADEANVYFTGSFKGSNLGINHAGGGTAETIGNSNNGTEEIIISSFNANGSHSWSQSISSLDVDKGWAISMDSDSLYLTGEISDQASFPGYAGNPVPSSGGRDIFISSHARSDGNTGWVSVLPSNNLGNESGISIDTDDNGMLYISGVFKEDLYFPREVFLNSKGGDDAFLTGYTTDGEFKWALSAGSTRNEKGLGISVGSGGAFYLGGFYDDIFTLGPLTLPDEEKHNGFVARLKLSETSENDEPCSAILLISGDTCNSGIYENFGASGSGIPDPGCGSYAGADLWFKAVIPASGNLFVGTNTSEDDTFPPTNGWFYRVEMAIYSGACSSLNLEGCYSHTSGYNFRASSAFLYDKNPGDTIWIRIWEAFGNDFGNFSICTYDPGHYPAWSIPEELCADVGISDLDETLAEMQFGFVDNVVGSAGVESIGNITGAQDGAVSKLLETGDWMKLDLTDTIPAGEILMIYFRSNFAFSPPTAMTINVSQDDITYYPHSFKPETDRDEVTPHYIITEHPTRYLYIENDNAGGGGFAVDGIKYFYRGTRGGTWSGPGITGSLFDPTGLSGPVSITYSVGGTTTRTDSTRTVEVYNSKGGILLPDTAVCAGAHIITMDLTNFNGEIIKWESSVNGFSTVVPIAITEGSYTVADLTQTTEFRVIVQDGSCSPDTSNAVVIEVFENPVSNAGSGSIVCALSAGLESIPSVGTGTWSLLSGPGSAIFTPNENNPVGTVNVDSYGSYEFLWTELNGVCIDTDTVAIDFLMPPEPDPGSAEDVCGDSTGLQAIPSSGSGFWSKKSGLGEAVFGPSPNDPIVSVNIDQYGTYEFTWTETNGPCIDDSTLSITFYEPPVVDPGSGGEVCDLEFRLNALPSADTGFWSMIAGPGSAAFIPSGNTPDATVTVSEPGMYEFLWMETNGVCTDDSLIIIVFNEPSESDAGSDVEICTYDVSYTLVGSTSSNGAITWTSSGNGDFDAQDIDNPTYYFSTDTGQVLLYKFVENPGLCPDALDSMILTITPSPVANGGVGGQLCGFEFQLSAIPSIGSGTWSMTSGPGIASFNPSANEPDALVSVSQPGSYEITWTEVNGICSDQDTIGVDFLDLNMVDAGTGGEVCGLVFNLNAISVTGSGQWSKVSGPGNVSFSPANTSVMATVIADDYGDYVFQWYETFDFCIGSDTVTVRFHPQPVSDAGPDQVLEFVFSTYLNAKMPEFGIGHWEIVGGSGQIEDIDDPLSQVTDLDLGENEFSWIIQSVGCEDVLDNVIITVNDIQTPTVITPNGDGQNDFLVFPGVEQLTGTEIIIFNRWGTEVYRNSDYHNDWEGRDHKSRELVPDTYFYILKIESERILKGFVEIRR